MSGSQASPDVRVGQIKRICIVGGGTAGWVAAAMLAHLYPNITVDLVESDDIGTIGVGESTIPPFLELIAKLGIDEKEFVRATQASFKLGIEFRDWRRLGERYFHPFGAIGMPVVGDFYQIWLRAALQGNARPLQDFAPASVMAREGRFVPPRDAPRSPIGGAAYALHVDAKRVARFLRDWAEVRGVVRTEGVVTDVATQPDGFIDHVVLKDGRRISADFFIDCSGFRAILIGKTLNASFDDWGHWLLCDRAIAVQSKNVGPPPPYTLSHAQPAGWRWRIPLQHRTGNGHVFSSKHMSDDEATALLLRQVEGPLVTDPMPVPFRTGVRPEMWTGNVLAVGLSAGFVEPLESTAIHLIYRGMDFFARFMPDRSCARELRLEYNRRMTADYQEIRDFIVLHYCLTQRDDTSFWKECRSMTPPPSLADRIALFRVNGTLAEFVDELFRPVSWQSVMDGMGVRPRRWHATLDRLDAATLPVELDRAADSLAAAVSRLPTHGAFIAKDCAAPLPV